VSDSTQDVALGAEDLELLRADLRHGKAEAVAVIASTPHHLAGARAGAASDRDQRDRILELLSRAEVVILRVREGGDQG
jgi:hypothetical protein